MNIQKTNLKKGFTLIELIVVITILAILGTIAFVNFNSYSGSARDSKRISDLRSINGKLGVALTEGKALSDLVTADASYKLSALSVAGYDQTETSYIAGSVNTNVLGIKSNDFKDKLNGVEYNYPMAILGVNGLYEVAATMENNGAKIARVVGNYSPRDLIAAANPTTINKNVITIPTLTFRVGDKLAATCGSARITSIGSGTLSLDKDVTGACTGVALAKESDGLIVAKKDASGATPATTVAIKNEGINLPY